MQKGLTFNLNQAAALCDVPPVRLAEWTDLGFVRADGQGPNRAYRHDTFRDILRLRRAFLTVQHGASSEFPAARATDIRSTEFAPDPSALSDDHLALRVQTLFLMNPNTAFTTAAIVSRLGAPEIRVLNVANQLLDEKHIAFVAGSWQAAEPKWRGLRLREQRIRVIRRKRLNAEPLG